MPLAASSKGTRRPTQSVTPTKWAVSSWARCSTPPGPGDGEVDRLAGGVREPVQARPGQLDQALGAVARREAEQHGAGTETPAVAEPLDEPLPLERADEARRRAPWQTRAFCELVHAERLRRLDDTHEQLRRTVDRLCAALGRHRPILWNISSTRVRARVLRGALGRTFPHTETGGLGCVEHRRRAGLRHESAPS